MARDFYFRLYHFKTKVEFSFDFFIYFLNLWWSRFSYADVRTDDEQMWTGNYEGCATAMRATRIPSVAFGGCCRAEGRRGTRHNDVKARSCLAMKGVSRRNLSKKHRSIFKRSGWFIFET